MLRNETTTQLPNGPRVGDFLGDYRLTALLGEGGMAKVFAAEHLSAGHEVALKILGNERSWSATAARSFELEAVASQRIGHPNVVAVLETGEHERQKYHVMERVSGVSLRELMDAVPAMTVARVVAIGRQLASALAATHAAGIVHRDIKPENVMVNERGGKLNVKLIDFGAAKDLNQPSVAGESIMGTPIYMAPEQMWGQPTTSATDVYAFGLLLYEMLAGKLPFKSRRFVELREERSTQEPTPLRVSLLERLRATRTRDSGPAPMLREAVPPELEALVMACLARSPNERPAAMSEVLERLTSLESVSRTPRARAVRRLATQHQAGPRRRHHALGYVAAALAVFASASTLVSDMQVRGPCGGAMIVASR